MTIIFFLAYVDGTTSELWRYDNLTGELEYLRPIAARMTDSFQATTTGLILWREQSLDFQRVVNTFKIRARANCAA